MKITIIGAGYVGLVTAVCFADLGNEVICVEKSVQKITKLEKGLIPFYEPDLQEILDTNIKNKRIHFTDDIKIGIDFSDIIFICVGTPQGDDGYADLSQVEETCRFIAMNINEYKLIVEKSTVIVNTHQYVKKTIKRYLKNDVHFDVASNPEFLREGSAIYDFMNPDRIIIGVDSKKAKNLFQELYQVFIDKSYPVIFTTPASAELIKHASNSFLAMKISYINMVASLCEKVDADVELIAEGMGYDKRIGKDFLKAGIGYGGSCFPKDVKAFINIANEHGVNFNLLEQTEKINKNMRMQFVKKIEKILWVNKEKEIAVWGLAFKPNTDDIREAPALEVVEILAEMGAKLRLYDPKAMDNFKYVFPESNSIKYFSDKYKMLKDADALIILTEWDEFKNPDFKEIRSLLRLKIIIDGRNIFNVKTMNDEEFEYYSIGRSLFDIRNIWK